MHINPILLAVLMVSSMAEDFILTTQRFLTIVNQLCEQGVKKKQIARHLGMYPSILSALVNSLLAEIAKLTPHDPEAEDKINQIFASVNNISEKKIRRKLGQYITTLESLQNDPAHEAKASPNHYLDDLIQASPEPMMSKLTGMYECYYVSSFGYRVKAEPFLIRPDSQGRNFVAQKGNVLGPSSFKGVAYLSNTHLLTVQMLEHGTMIQDHFMAHFMLPPSYPGSLQLFKGIAVSMSNAYVPISRKVVLKKVSQRVSISDYESMPTRFFENDEADKQSDIVRYLYNTDALIECFSVPQPQFNESDLDKELHLVRLR